MEITKNNHYVPQWYQNGFIDNHKKQLCYLTRYEIPLPNGDLKIHHSKKWHTSAQKFYEEHLYSTFFGTEVNDEIERKLFGPIDDNGSKAIRAFLTDDPSQWHHNFESLFTYLDSQKLRTPKGLDWIKSKYSKLNQMQLMIEMQSLRTLTLIHKWHLERNLSRFPGSDLPCDSQHGNDHANFCSSSCGRLG